MGKPIEPIESDELSSNDIYSLLMSHFGNLATPTAGQFRTFLAENKRIEITYAKAQVAVARMKRNRLTNSKDNPTPKKASASVARHSRVHGMNA